MHSPYPMHSVSANHGLFFADTAYRHQYLANASSGWNTSHAGNLPIAAGQQPVDLASYFSATSTPNTHMAYNPSIAFAPQTMHYQATESGYLAQIHEQDFSNDDMDTQERDTYTEGSEERNDSGSEG